MIDFTLRPWRESDAPALAKYADNPEISRNLRDLFPNPYTLEDAECFIRVNMAQEETQLCRAVVINGEAAGCIGVFPGNDVYRKTGELGYWLGEPFWGNGIVTDAVRQICREAFGRFDLVRIHAEVYARNTASRRVLEKNGFQLEGIRRKAVYKDGVLIDDCVYALLREEMEE